MTLSELRLGTTKRTDLMNLTDTFAGKSVLILGGTGFLGKVWWTLLLHRFPGIEQLYLVVRARPELTSEERFWSEVATNPGLDPLRELYGADYEDFLRQKVTVLDGDITQPFCGISGPVRDQLRGRVDAVANASGVVDFQPPLDVALEVNAFGCRNLVALAENLGRVPILHTSTCFVAGYRTGIVEEQNPLEVPFPFVGKLERAHWDPEREIAECLDIIEQAKHRANDAFRQSAFVDQAKTNLRDRGEPARGKVLEAEVASVRRRFVESQLSDFGLERAQFWGWPNTYTYTKSIGEQIVAKSGLGFCIVRPAIVESCVDFPHRGWNEGINTSAPLIYAIREGQPQFPGGDVRLDVIPCDMVATGMVLSLAELIRGEARPVYQYGTGDTNPISMARIYELSGLYKRKHFLETGRGSRLENFLQRHMEGAFVSAKHFDQYGPKALAKGAHWVAQTLERTPHGPLSSVASPGALSLRKFARKQEKVAHIIGQFIPFTAELDYEFRCGNTRAAFERLSDDEKSRLYWTPEALDWRSWFLEVHAPGLERWVFPHIERKLKKSLRALKPHQTLTELLEEMAERYGLAVALQFTEASGLSRVSYAELRARALACAERLQVSGVRKGDRVALVANNHPDWVIALFGVLYCDATAVPLAPRADAPSLAIRAQATFAILGEGVDAEAFGNLTRLRLSEVARLSADPVTARSPLVDPEALAVVAFSQGNDAPLMLTHKQVASSLAGLAPLLVLGADDRVLSLMPLSETFELFCGCLLPLSRGSRIVYLDHATTERLEETLEAGRITAIAAVPEVWSELSRTLLSPTLPSDGMRGRVVGQALDANRRLYRATGMDLGRLLFGQAHRRLGGHLRLLVSGGAPMDAQVAARFAGVGLPLIEGYEDLRSGALLTTRPSQGRSGGQPIPDVEIRIASPDTFGIGVVQARGPSLPKPGALGLGDGWVATGEVGRVDAVGRLTVLGADVDVIRSCADGAVYPLEVESLLRRPSGVREWALVGVPDGLHGERPALAVALEDGVALDRSVDARVQGAVLRLDARLRPTVVKYLAQGLPRLAGGRLDRHALKAMVAAEASATTEYDCALPRQIVAKLAGREVASVRRSSLLWEDLGIDSPLLQALAQELETALGLDGLLADLQRCVAVVDIERSVERALRDPELRPPARGGSVGPAVSKPARLLAGLALGAGEGPLFRSLVPTRVRGAQFLPSAGPFLVVMNASSGWEFNLARFAVGPHRARLRIVCWAGELPSNRAARAALLAGGWVCAVPESRGASAFSETALALLRDGHVVVIVGNAGQGSPDRCRFDTVGGAIGLEAGVSVIPLALAPQPGFWGPLLPRAFGACFGPPLRLDTTGSAREAADAMAASVTLLEAELGS